MWKDVVGYEDYFSISDSGELFSKRSNKILKLNLIGSGYLAHVTRINGRKGRCVSLKIHREVAKAFIPNPNNLPEVNHKDGNKKNNKVINLEWVTSSENCLHAHRTGLSKPKRGFESSSSKLTPEQVQFIKDNCKRNGGNLTTRELGLMFSVHHTNIAKASRSSTYK